MAMRILPDIVESGVWLCLLSCSIFDSFQIKRIPFALLLVSTRIQGYLQRICLLQYCEAEEENELQNYPPGFGKNSMLRKSG